MAAPERPRRLIVNADDFGCSIAANQAIIRAHREGILTTASLMVAGDAWTEAVELARQNPRLGVGLHLTLVCGRAVTSPAEIPALADAQGVLSDNPVAAGFRYFFSPTLRRELGREIQAQFARFQSTGLRLDHVNGHLNLHLHPAVFSLITRRAAEWGIKAMRVTRDWLGLNLRLAPGRWGYRLSHALIFNWLSRRARPILRAQNIRHTGAVFGLLQNGLVTEEYVMKLLPWLPAGDSELYSHPSLDQAPAEFEALVSSRVQALVSEHKIRLIRYQDL
jgi:chitin disaccharide deacetylase